MSRIAYLSLASSLMGLAYAAPDAGGGGSSPAAAGPDTNRVKYIISRSGEPGVIELGPSGRVLTEPFERPDWATGFAAAALYERNNFYQTRLGADRSEAHLGSNLINCDDLEWVAISDDDADMGDEKVVPASTEFRNETLMSILKITDEGELPGALADHYIDNDGKGYTLDELNTKQAEREALGQQEQKAASAKG